MKVLQKILSHGLLIAFIVAAFFAYTNRAELFPGWFSTVKTAQTEQSATPTPVTAPVQVAPVSEPTPEVVVEYRPVDTTEPALAPIVETAPSEYRPLQEDEVSSLDEAVTESPALEPELQADTSTPEQEATPQAEAAPQAEPAQVVETDTTSAPAPVAAESAPAQVTEPAAAVVADDSELQQRLSKARQLYWQRNVRAAAAEYQALGRDYPRNADVWGEIGNFYFSVRQSQPASMAYYRTVSLLIDSGDTQKARELLDVLYKLDANRGRELDARLQQSVN